MMEQEEWYYNRQKEKKSEKCEKLEKTLRDIMLFNGAESERQVNYKPV